MCNYDIKNKRPDLQVTSMCNYDIKNKRPDLQVTSIFLNWSKSHDFSFLYYYPPI